MNFKSWLQKINDDHTALYDDNDSKSENEHQERINVSVCKFLNKTPLKDTPAGKYIIIDKLFLFEDLYDRSIKQRFIFQINENKSYKINDIICYGSIITYGGYYIDPENQFEGNVEIVVSYNNDCKNFTLKEICNKHFQNLSLVNIKYCDVYRMTEENIIFKHNHYKGSSLMPNYFDDIETTQLDNAINEICEYT